jgi:hypothetical protein
MRANTASPGSIAVATLPDGTRKRFSHIPSFDAYLSVWRTSGFLLTWHDPWTVAITRRELDTVPLLPLKAQDPKGTPSTPSETSHGQV